MRGCRGHALQGVQPQHDDNGLGATARKSSVSYHPIALSTPSGDPLMPTLPPVPPTHKVPPAVAGVVAEASAPASHIEMAVHQFTGPLLDIVMTERTHTD